MIGLKQKADSISLCLAKAKLLSLISPLAKASGKLASGKLANSNLANSKLANSNLANSKLANSKLANSKSASGSELVTSYLLPRAGRQFLIQIIRQHREQMSPGAGTFIDAVRTIRINHHPEILVRGYERIDQLFSSLIVNVVIA